MTLNIIGKKYTYPIGLCKKENDFNEIHSELICNMKDWVSKRRKVFYYGTRKVQEIFIISFVSKMDEPERRSLLGLKLGNGLYSQCFGHIYDFVKCESELSSCESCMINNSIKSAHIQRNANLDAFEDQYCDNSLN